MEYAGSQFDIKELTKSGQIEGLLAGFGDLDRMDEIIDQGAFTKSLQARKTPLPMLLHHDLHRPIGAWKDWSERSDGLYVKGSIALSTKDGAEAYSLAKEGALTGLSVGFRSTKDARDKKTGRRVILNADLWEGSLVAVPAHPRANVSKVKAITGPEDIEEMLRAGGWGGREAKYCAFAAWKAHQQRNGDDAAEAELAALIRASTVRLREGVNR